MPEQRIKTPDHKGDNNISDKQYPKFDESANRLKSTSGPHVLNNIRIVFEPCAVEHLFDSIRWGQEYKCDDVQQAGILIGNYYRDISDNQEIIWGDVLVVVPAEPELVNASFESIDISMPVWRKMLDGASGYRTENLQVLGWYHTHLDHIDASFSSVDSSTHRKVFANESVFGVVFNPNQEKWSAFYGPHSAECTGELVLDDALEAKYGKPTIKIKQVSGNSQLREDGKIVHLNDSGHTFYRHSSFTYPSYEDDLSLGQVFSQFFSGLKQWASPKRRAGTNMSAVTTSSRNKAPQADNRLEAPKIEIKKVNRKQTKIVFFHYALSEDYKLSVTPAFKRNIQGNDITMIVRHNNNNRSLLWGRIKRSEHNMELSIVQEQAANARIIFHPNTSNSRITEVTLVNLVQEMINSKPGIIFGIIINDINPQKIAVHVIHFSRG